MSNINIFVLNMNNAVDVGKLRAVGEEFSAHRAGKSGCYAYPAVPHESTCQTE